MSTPGYFICILSRSQQNLPARMNCPLPWGKLENPFIPAISRRKLHSRPVYIALPLHTRSPEDFHQWIAKLSWADKLKMEKQLHLRCCPISCLHSQNANYQLLEFHCAHIHLCNPLSFTHIHKRQNSPIHIQSIHIQKSHHKRRGS